MHNARAATNLLIETFEAVGGAQESAVALREGKDREPFGEIGFQPGGQLGRVLFVLFDGGGQEGSGLGARALKTARMAAATSACSSLRGT